jgi:hypothetical protein
MGIGFAVSRQSGIDAGCTAASLPASGSDNAHFQIIRTLSLLPPFVRQRLVCRPQLLLHDLQCLDGHGEMLAKVRDFRAELRFGRPSPQIFDTHGASLRETWG